MSNTGELQSKPVIDIHIHIGGKGNSTSCYMSKDFLRSVAYFYMVIRSGIPLLDLFKDHDRALRERVLSLLNAAPHTDYGVLLALDGVYRPGGVRDDALTHMETPNEYVMEIAAAEPKVLFGASVHPARGEVEGLRLIDRCLEGGAVLMKWIPNSQLIDPNDAAHDWFYEKLAAENLPLLCHMGPEHAVPVSEEEHQKLGDPWRLERALEKGVTVIAAHCGAAFFPWERSCLEELSGLMSKAEGEGWKLYADISAMCSISRAGIIDDVLEQIPPHRMVYGSDFPVPVDTMVPWVVETLDRGEWIEISKIKNPFEKNHRQLLAMDFPEEAMTRTAELLRPTAKFMET